MNRWYKGMTIWQAISSAAAEASDSHDGKLIRYAVTEETIKWLVEDVLRTVMALEVVEIRGLPVSHAERIRLRFAEMKRERERKERRRLRDGIRRSKKREAKKRRHRK